MTNDLSGLEETVEAAAQAMHDSRAFMAGAQARRLARAALAAALAVDPPQIVRAEDRPKKARRPPREFWREVPCGHPPDPVAWVGDGYAPICHCGMVLDDFAPIRVPDLPPEIRCVVQCSKCGCGVGIPALSHAGGSVEGAQEISDDPYDFVMKAEGKRWTLSHDSDAEDDKPQAFRVSGPEVAFGSVEVMPVAEHDAELARLRAVAEAAQEQVDALDRGRFSSDIDTAWVKVQEACEALRAALSEYQKVNASDPLQNYWRVGRKVGRTIYIQIGSEPSDDDPLIGMMDTEQIALAAVDAHNRSLRSGFDHVA